MTSLSEVYEPDAEFETSLRRLYAGAGLFVLGAVLVLAGIVAATTHLFVPADAPLWQARELGGVLAGLGVPAVFIGIFAVLPADRRTRGAAVIGAAIAVLGVALFRHAYPCGWSGSNCGAGVANLTLPVTAIYFLGTLITFWCLFVGVANFKSRNNPGGTAQVEVTAQGETKVIEVPKSELSKFSGSLGVLGNTPDPEAETQTNRPGTGANAVSDGGATTQNVQEVADEDAVVERTNRPENPGRSTDGPTDGGRAASESEDGGVDVFRSGASSAEAGSNSATRSGDWTPTGQTTAAGDTGGADRDRYCGSCEHFQYVRTENGMEPYCAAHGVAMDDMEACADWSGREE